MPEKSDSFLRLMRSVYEMNEIAVQENGAGFYVAKTLRDIKRMSADVDVLDLRNQAIEQVMAKHNRLLVSSNDGQEEPISPTSDFQTRCSVLQTLNLIEMGCYYYLKYYLESEEERQRYAPHHEFTTMMAAVTEAYENSKSILQPIMICEGSSEEQCEQFGSACTAFETVLLDYICRGNQENCQALLTAGKPEKTLGDRVTHGQISFYMNALRRLIESGSDCQWMRQEIRKFLPAWKDQATALLQANDRDASKSDILGWLRFYRFEEETLLSLVLSTVEYEQETRPYDLSDYDYLACLLEEIKDFSRTPINEEEQRFLDDLTSDILLRQISSIELAKENLRNLNGKVSVLRPSPKHNAQRNFALSATVANLRNEINRVIKEFREQRKIQPIIPKENTHPGVSDVLFSLFNKTTAPKRYPGQRPTLQLVAITP